MKLIVPDPRNAGGRSAELYDVLADPFERKNLAQAQPETTARIARLIDGWWPAKDDGT